jgi:leucyl aminopeptidase
MTRLLARQGSAPAAAVDLLALFMFEDKKAFYRQVTALNRLAREELLPPSPSPFTGKESQTLILFPKKMRAARLVLVGVGPSERFSAEAARRGAAAAAKTARSCGAKRVGLIEPDPAIGKRIAPTPGINPWELFGAAVTDGTLLGLYRFDRYQKTPPDGNAPPAEVIVLSESASRVKSIAVGIARTVPVCQGTCLARDLENAPGNEIYPETMARVARASGRKHGFKVTVFDEKRIASLRMGGLLGVARGSRRPPRFIIMEYRGRGAAKKPVVLVGKGVTFDSGGISIKPSANMAEMKMDMAGSAAVIGTLQSAAALKLPVHLIGLVPATENLPDGNALKPGDILRHYNGLTSEIDNTDAEGRLILADALSYASRFSPSVVIDIATLTGAVVVALGHAATGMLGNDPATMAELTSAGERTYERVWQLPMFEEYDRLIKSDVADVKNTGGRWAGAITAAMFLRRFIGEYKWVHLDIAGTAIIEEASEYVPRGGSGVGVRLLIDFLRHRFT